MFAIEVAGMAPYASAYVAAGYRDSPWACYNASKLAHVPEVAMRIAELQAEHSERSGIHAEYIQRKLLPIVEANSKDLFEPLLNQKGEKIGDTLKAISSLPRDLAAAISKIKCDPGTGAVIEVALASKSEAGNILLRSLGGLVDRLEVTDKAGVPEGEFQGEIERVLGQLLGIGDGKLLAELSRALNSTGEASGQ
jgi:Terminase small subunit